MNTLSAIAVEGLEECGIKFIEQITMETQERRGIDTDYLFKWNVQMFEHHK